MHSEECCMDEDEFNEKIRLSKDARSKMLGKGAKERDEEAGDPIGEADKAGKRKYVEADAMWMRAARMDNVAMLYLHDRFKTCYKLTPILGSHRAVLNCFKDDFRSKIDCECEIRKYLNDVTHEKAELASEYAKQYKPKKKAVKDEKKDDKKTKKK